MNKFNLIFSFFNLKSSGLLFPVNSNNYPNCGSKVTDEDIFCGNCKKNNLRIKIKGKNQ